MTKPISTTTPISNLQAPSSPAATFTPIGIGFHPTILAPSAEAAQRGAWKKIVRYCESFSEFFRKILIKVMESLHMGLGVVIEWVGGKPKNLDTPPSAQPDLSWQLPQESPPLPAAPMNAVSDPFREIPITPPEQQNIYTIVNTLGQGLWASGKRAKELQRRGEQIDHVHPLKFLEYIFKHSELPQDLEKISNNRLNRLTWASFIAGITRNMNRDQESLPELKVGFARSLNVSLAELEPFFARSDWDGMIRLLIDVKTGKRSSVFVEPSPSTFSTTIPESPLPPATSLPLTVVEPSGPVVTSTPVLPVIAVEPPLPPADSTAFFSAETATPLPTTQLPEWQIADLQFEASDEQALSELITTYSQTGPLGLVRLALPSAQAKWKQIGKCHPLKVLSHLYSQPGLIGQLDAFQNKMVYTKFMSTLKGKLAKYQQSDITPYIDEFSRASGLNADVVRQQIENGNWEALIIDLKTSRRSSTSVYSM